MDTKVHHQSVDADLRRYVNAEEEQRLKLLEERIERKKRILAEPLAERQKIMKRAIRRMRRAVGKS